MIFKICLNFSKLFFYIFLQKSDTVSNIAESAKSGISSGVGFLYGKLFGARDSSNDANNHNQISSENFNRNNSHNNTEPVQYVKMDEKLNQKFLDN